MSIRAPSPGVFSSASVSAASERVWTRGRREGQHLTSCSMAAALLGTHLVANLSEVRRLPTEDVRHLGLAHRLFRLSQLLVKLGESLGVLGLEL